MDSIAVFCVRDKLCAWNSIYADLDQNFCWCWRKVYSVLFLSFWQLLCYLVFLIHHCDPPFSVSLVYIHLHEYFFFNCFACICLRSREECTMRGIWRTSRKCFGNLLRHLCTPPGSIGTENIHEDIEMHWPFVLILCLLSGNSSILKSTDVPSLMFVFSHFPDPPLM